MSRPEQPASGAMDPLLTLQTTVGNRAVSRMVAQRAGGEPAGATAPPAAGQPGAATPAAAAPSGLIVEDDVTGLRPEQLTRSAFLAQARAAAGQGVREGAGPLASRAEAELASTAARYQGQSAAQLEATVRREIDGAAGASSAAGLIDAIRRSGANEARNRISDGLPDAMVPGARDLVANATQALSAVTGLLFKGRDGSPTAGAGDVAEARAHLGAGDSVPGSLRSEVEQATGADLSGVRVHRDGPATAQAHQLGARAFTVGSDIVLGPGEEGPGTLVGDALLAHELAHAAQQSGGPGPAEKSDGGSTDQAETAADDVAVAAVVAERTGLRGKLAAFGSEAAHRMKLGLRLQRCGLLRSDPTKEDLNKKVLEMMGQANKKGSADKGLHYPYNYESNFPKEWEAKGRPSAGYANPAFWTRVEFMHWVRKPGVSASAAMDAFFAGPTIADCASVGVASNIAALRNALGDAKFDKAFGGDNKPPRADPATGKRYHLEIGQGVNASILQGLMRESESAANEGPEGRRNVSPGQLHYFKNHPDYPKRHSTGFWQGENALYVGEEKGQQMFSGFGATKTEAAMNAALVEQYNKDPTPEDVEKKRRLYAEHGPDVTKWPEDLKKFHGEGPAHIEVPDLIKAGGGFQGKLGQELDPAKVKALKDSLD